MAAALLIRTFAFKGMSFAVYACARAGDELAIHSHPDYAHLTRCETGRIEAFDDAGPIKEAGPDDPPFEFRAGRRHGIRALADATRFVNYVPTGPVT